MTKHGCKIEDKPEDTQTVDIVVAEPPFNDAGEDADLILRTSNNVHFYVNKTILAVASPVFKDMISIPNQSAQGLVDHRPCVFLQDDSIELYQLLSWCDPRGIPSIKLEAMQVVLRLADKYGMETVTRRIENVLESSDELVKADCLRAYALSSQYHFPHVIQTSARYSLTIPQQFFLLPELDSVSGGTVQRLHAFHFACGKAAVTYIRTGGWITEQYINAFCVALGHSCPPEGRPIQFGTKHLELKKWFATYIKKIESLLLECPSAAIVLDPSTYRETLISMASCGGCRHHVRTFLSFVTEIAEEVDKATKEIEVHTSVYSVGK